MSHRGLGLSHLFFADDLLLFCRVDDNGATSVKQIPDTFCHFSGHRVSHQKTRGFFSKNVSEDVAMNLCTKLGFTRVADLGKCLGVPLFHNRVCVNTFHFIIEKVLNRLNGWDVRKLSLAGRLTLVKFVLLTIPNYFMSTASIPISICKEIEKMARGFLWGSSSSGRKPALVKWTDCCKPIVNGGLGI